MEKEREREKRMVMRVDEPRTSALFAEFTHYQNTLLVPMVRSPEWVSGSRETEPARREIRGAETSFTISAFIRICDLREYQYTRSRCHLPKSATIMITGNAKLDAGIIRAKHRGSIDG